MQAVWLNLEDTYDAAGGALVAFFDAAGRTVSSVGGRYVAVESYH